MKRPTSKREIETQDIIEAANESFKENRGICDLDKMLADVREKYPRCNRKRLYSIQKRYKLYSKRKRKFKAITCSNHKLPVAENLLNQNFNVD